MMRLGRLRMSYFSRYYRYYRFDLPLNVYLDYLIFDICGWIMYLWLIPKVGHFGPYLYIYIRDCDDLQDFFFFVI